MAENGSPKKPVGGHEKLLRASLYFYILVKKCWKGTVFFLNLSDNMLGIHRFEYSKNKN